MNSPEMMCWAFGDDYELLDPMGKLSRWNKRHGIYFEIKANDLVEDSMKRIREIWYERKKNDLIHKALKIGGSSIRDIFSYSKSIEKTEITSEEGLRLTNTYGLSLREIIFIAASHGMTIDEKGYRILFDKQEKPMSYATPKKEST